MNRYALTKPLTLSYPLIEFIAVFLKYLEVLED